MSLTVGETAFSKALAYAAQVVGGFAVQVSATTTQPTLSLNDKVFHEPVAIARALISSKPIYGGNSPAAQAEFAQWVESTQSTTVTLDTVESTLTRRSYVGGHSLTLSDFFIYSQILPLIISLNSTENQDKYTAVKRWIDQLNHEAPETATLLSSPLPSSIRSALPATLNFGGANTDSKKAAKAAAKAEKKTTTASTTGTASSGSSSSSTPAPAEVSPISECEFRVGFIKEAWRHPESEKLYCEKIDFQDPTGPREIASGLVPYFSLEQMQNRRVVVVTNLKPRPLAGFMSNGMVLCATSTDGKTVEFVEPPAGAVIGERITFEGHTGPAAEPNRMAKKKIFEAVAPDLVVNDSLQATYKGIPFMTSAGPCTVVSAKGGLIK